MSVVVKTALARVEGTCQVSPETKYWAIDNLSSEDLWVSMVTGEVVEQRGRRVPGGTTFFSGQLEPDPFRKVYFSCRQPNVKLRIRTDADALQA